jgi:DNA polymerase (family 10)
VIELTANPHRFDLDWRLGKLIRENGVKVSINPDAHTTGGILDTFYGVGIARKAGLTKKDVINTLSVKAVVSVMCA